MGRYAENDRIRWHTFSHIKRDNQGWKYGDTVHNSAGKLRAVRFAASQIGDESLKCPVAKIPIPLTTTEKMMRKGKRNRQDMATFTITVYYTKALG